MESWELRVNVRYLVKQLIPSPTQRHNLRRGLGDILIFFSLLLNVIGLDDRKMFNLIKFLSFLKLIKFFTLIVITIIDFERGYFFEFDRACRMWLKIRCRILPHVAIHQLSRQF